MCSNQRRNKFFLPRKSVGSRDGYYAVDLKG
jgi:hypothetical protein